VGLEGLLVDAAGLQIADAHAVEGLALAGLDELVLEDDAGVAVEKDLQAGPELVGTIGRHVISRGWAVDGMQCSLASDESARCGSASLRDLAQGTRAGGHRPGRTAADTRPRPVPAARRPMRGETVRAARAALVHRPHAAGRPARPAVAPGPAPRRR